MNTVFLSLLGYLEGLLFGALFSLALIIPFAVPVLMLVSIIVMIANRKKKDRTYKACKILLGICIVLAILVIVCIAWLTDGFSRSISFM
ncbi:MAG: hypothetical protein IJY08_00750 [Clostridia bacterium]|nr:hypothetical protein [Clostridia bacterium]